MAPASPLEGASERNLTDIERKEAAIEKEQVFVLETTSECHAIALHILRLACNSNGHVGEHDLKPLLVRLYNVICGLADYRRGVPVENEDEDEDEGESEDESENEGEGESEDESVESDTDTDDESDEDEEEEDFWYDFTRDYCDIETDRALLKAWYAVLEPVDALSKLEPDGPFLAARMILFTQHSTSKSQSLPHCLRDDYERLQIQADMGQAFDEALLVQLRRAWERGGQKDNLSWASTYLEVSNSTNVSTDYNLAVMSACSPSEFRVARKKAAKHIKPRKPYPSTPLFSSPHDVPSAKYGPIAMTLFTTLTKEEDSMITGSGVRGPCLRRSYYFVQDIEQKMASAMSEEKLQLATLILQQRLPPELQESVMDYLSLSGELDFHPYLARLDIGAAYTPLPKHETLDDMDCDECIKNCNEEPESHHRTCPTENNYIWNVALRAFHTFHEAEDGSVFMCKHQGICQAHHTDLEWQVTTKEDVRQYVIDIFESRCHTSSLPATSKGWFEAMTTINPHTNPQSFAVPDAPHSTPRMSFPSLRLKKAVADQRYRREGGLCGIVSSMLHSYVHQHGPNLERPLDRVTPGQWAYGRSLDDEEMAAEALLDLPDE